MDWKNVLWLAVGIGLGMVLRSRKPQPTGIPQFEEPEVTLPVVPVHSSTSPNPLNPPDFAEVNDLNELRSQLHRLQLAYQMATESSQFKGGFLGRISHELRSPLSGLIGMHQLILSDLCDSPEEERDFIAQANTSAQKMVAMLGDVVFAARVQHGTAYLQIQPVELAEIFRDLYRLTYLQAQDRNLRLELLPVDPNLYVLADPLWLRQVLVHLVDAAIQQLPEGTITVSAELADTSQDVYIWVNDQLPASARSELSNTLHTEPSVPSNVPSPGLTLFIDQILLESMQGKLEVFPAASIAPSASDNTPPTRLRCSIPVVIPED